MKANATTRTTIFFMDTFFGFYLAITLHRSLWFNVILGSSAPEFFWSSLLWYGGIGLIYALIAGVMRCSVGAILFQPEDVTGLRRTIAVHTAWILVLMTFTTGWIVTKISFADLFTPDRMNAAGRLFSDVLNPNWDIFGKAALAMVETIYLAFTATALALPLSFLLGFLSARNLMKDTRTGFTIYTVLRVLTNFTRSIEPLVWAVIFTVWVGVGPFPGMLALMVHTISSLAKQYSEQIEDIDDGPMEAIEATGANRLQVIWFAVVPQIVIPFLSFTIYRWDINVRMATVIGLVGGGGIGSMLIQYQMLSQWREVGLIVLLIAIVVWLMDYISAKVREALQ